MTDPKSDAETQAAEPHAATADTMAADLASTPASATIADDRYARGDLIGKGGMGIVHTCADRLLGRQVALKTIRGETPTARARFVREARVQAILEHPSIVPVYDMGRTTDGAPWFTMRRIGGDTLEHVLRRLAQDDADVAAHYGRRRLLGDFVRVCQAVAYAHSRGVIHRDLKPANVILSEYGEVYVLDWGVAKVRGEPNEDTITALPTTTTDGTADGAVLGTLGYMPPEQLGGATADIDARADVYALGAILFELLTLQPLHERGSASALVHGTLTGADARATTRAPDREVPPELEQVCVRATATARDDRYPDVREMIAALEAYLDGDRDQARRRELAQEHARLAAAAMERADRDLDAREQAAREAGRALAFDPVQPDALRIVTRLVVEPPTVMPPEILAKLHAGDQQSGQAMARFGAIARVVWLGLFAGIAWMGVRNWWILAGLVVLLGSAVVGAWRFGMRETSGRIPTLVIVQNSAMLGLMSTLFGPFVLVPILAAVTTSTFLLGGAHRLPIPIAFGLAAVFAPYVLEQLAVVPRTTAITDGAIVISPVLAWFPVLPTHVVLVATHVGAILMVTVAVAGTRARLRRARTQELLQAWHFERVLPANARA